MPLKEMPLKIFNKLLNTLLINDPNSIQKLKPLQNKILAIHIQGPDKTLYCQFNESDIQLSHDCDTKPNTTISGGPFSLLALAKAKDTQISGVTIEGEIDTVQCIKQLSDDLALDWEGQLAEVVGDTPAYHINKVGKKLKSIFTKRKESAYENLSDYLKTEKAIFPDTIELDDFYHQVDAMHLKTERLNEKLKRLQKELNA